MGVGWIAWGRRKLYGHGAVPQGCPKVRRILEIWASGMGVISLHCFQSSVPAEAYTREGCMLEALGEWGMGAWGDRSHLPVWQQGDAACPGARGELGVPGWGWHSAPNSSPAGKRCVGVDVNGIPWVLMGTLSL